MTATVNLLDRTCEPSGEQLEALMRDAAARAEAAVANKELRDVLATQMAGARVCYLSMSRMIATAAL